MFAIWGIEHDHREDKYYDCPTCRVCMAPIYKDGEEYRCVSCQELFEVDDEMREWIDARNETKVETGDCPVAKSKRGDVWTSGCGGVGTMKIVYVRNPVTMKWEVHHGECQQCGLRFMV